MPRPGGLALRGPLGRLPIVDTDNYLYAIVNILEVTHQRVFSDLPAKRAMLDVVIETRDRRHLQDAVACLRAAGFVVDIRKSAPGHP